MPLEVSLKIYPQDKATFEVKVKGLNSPLAVNLLNAFAYGATGECCQCGHDGTLSGEALMTLDSDERAKLETFIKEVIETL